MSSGHSMRVPTVVHWWLEVDKASKRPFLRFPIASNEPTLEIDTVRTFQIDARDRRFRTARAGGILQLATSRRRNVVAVDMYEH